MELAHYGVMGMRWGVRKKYATLVARRLRKAHKNYRAGKKVIRKTVTANTPRKVRKRALKAFNDNLDERLTRTLNEMPKEDWLPGERFVSELKKVDFNSLASEYRIRL